MQTIIQTLFDESLFDNYDEADEVVKGYKHFERRRPSSEDLNDVSQ